MAKITKRSVDTLECVGARPVFLWDDLIAGFGVKALPSGSKKYVVKYRANGGGRGAQQRWISLGGHGQVTCDQARGMAQQVLAAVARGEDPQGEKFKRRSAPTLNDVWIRFEGEYLQLRKPQTRQEYQSQWRDLIGPKFGRRTVDGISRGEIDQFHKSMKHAPYRANRVLALCSRLMTLAEVWEWREAGSNPCRYIQRYDEKPRTRYLAAEEIQRVGISIKKLVAQGKLLPSSANVMHLLLLTGARLNELLTAQWSWIDWERRILILPDSKTGEKAIYLSHAALALLQRQREIAAGSDFVFPGQVASKPMVNLRKPWMRVCEDAGVEGVRLHDLRHTAASIAVGQGASLPIIGRLLGHSQAQTTLRYAHVDADPALAAANQIGEIVEDLM
ncbi:site-specific integrase [Sphingomonas sp. C3-2]|uniref:tyrosine-type recombinase/integrase n=1 Tax=Sphingomonas sp. C3-2 TaxID=3062169 RepID=UPI00294B7298|nr:site-specific integrase [Sphingomonas sp. C3-2]WOK37305.1 site-specific integrase [Sphingomonas sp. C3-2]